MLDAVIVSDIHLGAKNCFAKEFNELLDKIHHKEIETRRLIINGDLFDNIDFRRLCKKQWKILSKIRKISSSVEVTWNQGNHDAAAEIISHLIGTEVVEEYQFESGETKILCFHGDRHDEFLTNHPFITWIADCVYGFLQTIDPSCYFAKLAKKSSKTFLRCTQAVQDGAIKDAIKAGCNAVCVGHTHAAITAEVDGVKYYNGGCWTENPPSYLTVDNGKIELVYYCKESDIKENCGL